MSCALPSPESGVCANRRPVHGRRAASTKVLPGQAPLVPLAEGHQTRVLPTTAAAAASAAPAAARAATATNPFPTDAPEATFSLAQLTGPVQQRRTPGAGDAVEAAPVAVRSGIPTFSEIRLARAAAAGRAPVAEVRIPLADLEQPQLAPQAPLDPGMDQLLERVRQRTAARRSRAGGAAQPPR